MNETPQIVVLDGYTLTHDDLTWEALQSLGNCIVYDRSPPANVLSHVADADIILTNKIPLTRETINQLPRLKYIGVTATGTNIIDLAAARERGIVVTNVPGYSTNSVAQLTFAHLLNLAQHVGDHAQAVRSGRWADAARLVFLGHAAH